MSRLTESPAWRALAERYEATADITLAELFAADPERTSRFTSELGGIVVDASKTHLTPSIHEDLLALAGQEDVPGWRDRMFAGERINRSEQRAALHPALRTPELADIELDGVHVGRAIERMQARMAELVEGVDAGRIRGADGGPVTDIINLGIGGSDMGPRLACEALRPQARTAPRVHFVSNLDPADREHVLAEVDPARALFIVTSKTFTTLETLSNARALFDRLAARVGAEAARTQFVAVTARADRALEWGIDEQRILPLWDWVGGRYSLWSAVGLPVAFALGMDGFRALLAGAAHVDRHFRDAPMEENLPLRLALLDIWYGNFAGMDSHVIIPYSERLAQLPHWLQQLEMESNGKSVDRGGEPIDHATAPAVWGQVGTTGQHAFFQWLHQGTRPAMCDFVLVNETGSEAHAGLLANGLAQTSALLAGRSTDALRREGVEEWLRPHRAMAGNRPSVTLVLDGLGPDTLGSLLALYEHRVFCQAMLWRINPFDQWGVERGKVLARRLTPVLRGEPPGEDWDPSTLALLERCRRQE